MDYEKVYKMKFSKVYPLLVNKVLRKGRTDEEVKQIITWLTGYKEEGLREVLEEELSYLEFFERAPSMNPNRRLIKGQICGVRVEDIEERPMQEIRYLDKLIDELAKGKGLDKIFRENE